MDEYEVDDSQGRTVRVRLPGTMLPTLANLQRAYELQSGTGVGGLNRPKAAAPRLAFQQNPTVVRLRKKIGLNMPSGRALPPAPPLQRTRERVLKNNGALQRLIKQQQVIDKGGSAMGTLKARDAKEPPFPLPPNIFDPNTYAERPSPYWLSEPSSGDIITGGATILAPYLAPGLVTAYGSRAVTAALLQAKVRPALANAGGLAAGIGLIGPTATPAVEGITRGIMGQEKYQDFSDARQRFREENPLGSAVVDILPGYAYGAGINKSTVLADAAVGGGLELFDQYRNYIDDPYAESFNPNWGRVGIGAVGNATQARPTRLMASLAPSADAFGVGVADFGRGATRAAQQGAQQAGAAAARASRTSLGQGPSMNGLAFLQALFEELQSPTGGGGGTNGPRGVPQTDWESLFPDIPERGEPLRRIHDPNAPLVAAQVGRPVQDLIDSKRYWSEADYQPADVANDIVNYGYLSGPFAAALKRKDNVFLPMPSTSGMNNLPDLLAKRLQENFNGEIVSNFATPRHRVQAKRRKGLSKISEPSQYEIARDMSDLAGRNVYVVDDFFTTGDSTVHLQEALADAGLPNSRVAVLGALTPYKPGAADLIYATRMLSSLTDTPPEVVAPMVQSFFMRYGRGMINRIFDPLENAPERQARRDARRILDIITTRTGGTVPGTESTTGRVE